MYERIGFGLYQFCWIRVSIGRVCFGCSGVCGVGRGLGPGSGGVGLCLHELGVWIFCVDGRSRYLSIVLGGYLRICGAPSVQSCFTLWISAS